MLRSFRLIRMEANLNVYSTIHSRLLEMKLPAYSQRQKPMLIKTHRRRRWHLCSLALLRNGEIVYGLMNSKLFGVKNRNMFVGFIYKINGILGQYAYVNILESIMFFYSREKMLRIGSALIRSKLSTSKVNLMTLKL